LNIQTKDETEKKPEIIVFAGPNGSGKSTFAGLFATLPSYINADEIERSMHCSVMEAAQKAEELRESALNSNENFSFETVLSTRRNLDLLKRAKQAGYFIRGYYILTSDPEINVIRVKSRQESGGHGVPRDKITERYYRALKLIPEFVEVCDICHIYDNTDKPFRIFKKRKENIFVWGNDYWDETKIKQLVGLT